MKKTKELYFNGVLVEYTCEDTGEVLTHIVDSKTGEILKTIKEFFVSPLQDV